MGGCKCTYRNCTVKSDGKTHLFHYPVFNKVRCHQWIINANRYEFLNLKVSQLKNRVVCQYHFKDDNFMNCQKAKLTMDAIPTEDGPYCDPTKWKKDPNIGSVLPFLTDEIENDVLTYEQKVANYSIKYADFLTNFESDLLNSTNLDSFSLDCKDNIITNQTTKKCSERVFHSNANIQSPLAVVNPFDKSTEQKNHEITLQEIILGDNVVLNEEKSITQCEVPQTEVTISSGIMKQQDNVNDKPITPSSNPVKLSKVKILSEKKIKNAILLPKNLQPISPSSVIKLQKKNNQTTLPTAFGTQPLLPFKRNVNTEEKWNSSENLVFEKQEPPQYTLDIQYQTLENEQPSYSLNLNSVKDENSSLNISQSIQQGNILGSNSIIINEPHIQKSISSSELQAHNAQPLYTIDMNGKKQKLLTVTVDTNRQETHTEQNPLDIALNKNKTKMLCLNNLLPEENQSVIKILGDKYMVNVEYDNEPEIKSKLPKSILKPQEPCTNDNLPSKGSRVSPNRLAAIEKKRKFNKKLIDAVIALDNNMQQTSSAKIVKVVKYEEPKNKETTQKAVQKDTQVSSYLSSDPNLPSVHEYTLKFLEDRLQQMENKLLGKIDQNSQRINEMRDSIKPKLENKTVSIQASASSKPESYKRQLYNEISQFLSPTCSSAVYEELFINKYSIKKSDDCDEVMKKRRRCR